MRDRPTRRRTPSQRQRHQPAPRPHRAGVLFESVLLIGVGVVVAALVLQNATIYSPDGPPPTTTVMLADPLTASQSGQGTVFATPAPITAVPIAPTATPVVVVLPSPAVPEMPGPLPYLELGQYEKFGQRWSSILVEPDPDTHSLVLLAQHLHAADPNLRYRFFDDDTNYEQYMTWHLNYPNASVPYPEDWVNEHHHAVIDYILRREHGERRWLLVTPYGEVIAELGE